MPRGVPQIEVTFDVDANGILNVSAVEKSTGKSNKITITNDKARLNKDDIERLVAEAEKYAAEDKLRLERVEARNGLEAYLYNVRNTMNEEKVKSSLSDSDRTDVETNVNEGLEWLSANESATTEEFKEKQKYYEERIRPVMMKLYGGSGGDGSGNTDSAPGPGPKVEEVD